VALMLNIILFPLKLRFFDKIIDSLTSEK